MTDLAWIDLALTSARPQAMGALLRYFRNLDLAEEAFQEACLRALKNWPEKGPPRDPAAWLIFVGRNSGIDQVRKRAKHQPLPAEEVLSDLEDTESDLADRLDGAHYRDDILRLLVEYETPLADIIAKGHDRETLKKVERLLYLAEYKRRQAAPGVKISARSFGRDRRYPITNKFREDV